MKKDHHGKENSITHTEEQKKHNGHNKSSADT